MHNQNSNSDGMEPEHMRKVFIGGLHPETTDESMNEYFSKYGTIVDCIVMRDGQTRRSRGFGFVAFDKSSCVDLLQSERPHTLDGKEVDTKRVVPKTSNDRQPRSDRELKVNKLFVGGLKDDLSEDDMRQYFGQFGSVEKVETFVDKETNKRKGFCFITFVDFDSVDKCMLQVESSPDGKLVIAGFKVDVKKARSQEEMREAGGWKGGRGGGRGRGGYNRGGGHGGGYGDYGNGGGYNQGYGGGYGNQGGGYGNQGGYGGGQGGYNQGYGGGGQGGFNQGYGGGQGGYNQGYGGQGDSGYGNQGGGWGQDDGWQGSGNGYQGGYGGNQGGGPMKQNYGAKRPAPYGGGGRY